MRPRLLDPLFASLTSLPGIGPKLAKLFARLTDRDPPRVLDVLSAVRREDFVPARYRNLAFADTALPIGHDEVMMKPDAAGADLAPEVRDMLAKMLELAMLLRRRRFARR